MDFKDSLALRPAQVGTEFALIATDWRSFV
jgi:hypothetical protein